MLVGATARDVLLDHVFGIAPRRATYDIDFAVAVKDWGQFGALRAHLLAQGRFIEGGGAQQRLRYVGENGDLDTMLDLVPFGGIAGENKAVAWPPDMKIMINMAGYDEVFAAAEVVQYTPDFAGSVVSLPGLAILKLIAWADRGRENDRDARDLIHLMANYTHAGNADRVYDDADLLQTAGYDTDLVAVYLLGQDMRHVATAETLTVLLTILERDAARLANDMIKANRHLANVEEWVDQRLRLLRRALSTPAASTA